MARIAPLPEVELPESVRPILEFATTTMGFTANDVLTMARWPELLQAMTPVVGVLFSPGRVDMDLKRLVALVTSMAGGCPYCVAHNVHGAIHDGIDPAKSEAVWEFATSPLYTDAERAALTFARAVGQTPNALTDREYAELRRHFDDAQIMELTGVACLFAFLNRWNSTFQTQIEDKPKASASMLLGSHGWSAGAHE